MPGHGNSHQGLPCFGVGRDLFATRRLEAPWALRRSVWLATGL
ncbi:hypothetical protein [Streptomyces flaveolus]